MMLRSVFWAAVFCIGGFALWTQFANWNELFLATCPNKDSLVWDGNMRFVQAIDIVDDARRGVILPGISSILASPTWPPLRTLFSIVLLVWNGSPDPVLDGRPSAFFLFATAALLFAFAFFFRKQSEGADQSREALRPYFNGLLALTVLFLLLGIVDLPQFVFSSMLEIQGMFFFTWNTWAAFSILRHIDAGARIEKNARNVSGDWGVSGGRSRSDASASALSAASVPMLLLWSFALSGAGLYLTKYPFGILTGMALLLVCIVRSPGGFASAVIRVLKERYTGWHLIPLGLLAAAALIIVLGPYLGSAVVNTKGVKRFLYLAIVIVFIDFNHYLYRCRPDFFSTELRLFYLYFLLPFVFILLSHPDRFGSLVQAQTDRVPGGSRFYPVALFQEYFLASDALAAIVLGGLASALVAFAFALKSRSRHEPASSSEGMLRYTDEPAAELPSFLRFLPERTSLSLEGQMILFVWANIFVMQFMTSNHQARYLFQIFPVFLFFHGMLFWQLGRSLPGSSLLRQTVPLLMILPLPLLAARPLLAVSSDSRNVCFATTDPAPIDAARRIAAHVPENTDAILLNDFHDTASPVFGRRQATEIDLFLRYRTYGGGRIRTDSKYRYPTWIEDNRPIFNELVHVTYLCGEKAGQGRDRATERALKAGVRIEPVDTYNDPDGLCMTRYRLLPSR
ncbi:hypothetical protein [Leptonema illini]|uniref:Uncharacterized protein n=1 Tax=Leptonema illini DSM 21528 TaxID=929563 RepID=H2CBR3_9LEPT|nr:hypothetical protein [Leptonema illini]EHQ08517.1 hypothetical protein Lepil_3864 [Leptonema illini DSM 21528]